jgi:hypothetical protein
VLPGQVAAAEARRRSEATAGELLELRRVAEQLRAATEADRQQQAVRHLASLQARRGRSRALRA